MQNNHKAAGSFDMSLSQIIALFRGEKNSEAAVRVLLYMVGILLTPITLFGALLGFKRAYERLEQESNAPVLSKLKPITWLAMIIGAIVMWLLVGIFTVIASTVFGRFFQGEAGSAALYIFLAINFVITIVMFRFFKKWQNNVNRHNEEKGRFGSARIATFADVADLISNVGMYIGGGIYRFIKQGHRLICAGAGGGKFVNLIAPGLLDLANKGSWFIIDPKGELIAVTGRFQKERGKKVVAVDPWEETGQKGSSFNPLDLVVGQKNPDYLIDDISIIAEMIVPRAKNGDQFWTDRARSLVSGLLMHLVLLKDDKTPKALPTLWRWLRLPEAEWHELLADMAVSENAIVAASANELLSIINSEKTYTSIIASAQDATDFLKSPALQQSLMSSDFNINDLSNGKTVVYVVIPADKLESQSRFLRLMTATALRAVIRNKNQRVTFLLEEMAALGYMPEILTALSTYRSYNVSIMSVIQDLGQLKRLYGEAWETFLSNSVIKQFFNVSDRFSLDYLSSLFGETTHITYKNAPDGTSEPVVTSRKLFTQDEIRRGSGDTIFTLIEQRPVVCFPKIPYYEMPELQGTYDPNPHYTPDAVPSDQHT